MKLFKSRLYYYLGHITWLTCMKYWYIPNAHDFYSYCMSKSIDLDTENVVWSEAVPQPEKDDV